jgi:hypothetical protein
VVTLCDTGAARHCSAGSRARHSRTSAGRDALSLKS